jgi:hypothetical protein
MSSVLIVERKIESAYVGGAKQLWDNSLIIRN